MSDAADVAVQAMKLIQFFIQSGVVTPDDVRNTFRQWTTPAAIAPASRDTLRRDVQMLVSATPQLNVLESLSPCAGSDTLRVRYKKDGSTDCVDVTKPSVLQMGNDKFLFITTVDSTRTTNNVLIYQFVPDGAKFLGTATYDSHPRFHLVYNSATDSLTESFDDPNGRQRTCELTWNGQRFDANCR